MIRQDIIELFRVPTGKKIRLRDYDTGWAQTKEMKALGKDTAMLGLDLRYPEVTEEQQQALEKARQQLEHE